MKDDLLIFTKAGETKTEEIAATSYDQPSKISQICRSILTIAIPCIMTAFCDAIWEVMGIHFIDTLNNTMYLAAVGVGYMWSNISTLSIVFGFSTALQTLCSQSYESKQYYLCGVYHLGKNNNVHNECYIICLSALL